MALARTHAAAVVGVTGHLVAVEGCLTSGVIGLHLTGLADTTIYETRDRVRAAVINSGLSWPNRHLTVSLYPASLPKRGSGFDLPIAVALLAATGAIPAETAAEALFVGELGLNGSVRPVRGVLPAVLAAGKAGISTVYVAAANATETTQVRDVTVVPVTSLAALVDLLRDPQKGPASVRPGEQLPEPSSSVPHPSKAQSPPGTWPLDLADVVGNEPARHALEVCAAGGHNLALHGPPGSGMTMLAERLPTILPPLDEKAALEVAAVHSCAGAPAPAGPPFVSPHHTTTVSGMCGGGSARAVLQPGAISIAHRGVLFLDQADDFSAQTLQTVATALETRETTPRNGAGTVTLPAHFQLVIASRLQPCPRPDEDRCRCPLPWSCAARATGKLSALLDRIEVMATTRTPPGLARACSDTGEPSAVVAERVRAARERAATRLADTPWRTNAEVPGPHLRRLTARAVHEEALTPVLQAVDTERLSARKVTQALRVAWTLADLHDADRPNRDDIAAALTLQKGGDQTC